MASIARSADMVIWFTLGGSSHRDMVSSRAPQRRGLVAFFVERFSGPGAFVALASGGGDLPVLRALSISCW